MYGLKVYITPKDIIDRLCDEDKARFSPCKENCPLVPDKY